LIFDLSLFRSGFQFRINHSCQNALSTSCILFSLYYRSV